MEREKESDLNGGSGEHSKIDLEDVDSWLPEKVQRSLAKMIALQGRGQLRDVSSVYEPSTGSGGIPAEWQDMPLAGKNYHALMQLDLLDVAETISLGDGGDPLEGSSDEDSGVDGEEAGGSEVEAVPHYY